MKIKKIYSYLSYPSKHKEKQPKIGGATIPQSGRLYAMLKEIFDKSDKECNIPICFSPKDGGTQKNDCRDELINLINSPSIGLGRKIAERLQSVTTGKSGMGLLFIILAQDKKSHKIMISRFPADQGIMAEQNSMTLKVEFVEQVFLKNANSYKAAVYEGTSTVSDYWVGNAVDKQTNHATKDVADYWIKEFLLSDFKTTSNAGTKRLAVALRNSIASSEDLSIKHELTSIAILAKNLSGKNISINEFCDQYKMTGEAKKLINKQLKSSRLAGDKFLFNLNEFNIHLSYKTLEIDNGAILTAPLNKFDDCFQEQTSDDSNIKIFQTRGTIVNEKLKKNK